MDRLQYIVCLAAMILCGIQAPVGASEIVHFTSAVLPPTAFKLRQAEAQGKELKPAPGLALSGRLARWVDRGYTRASVLTVSALAALIAILRQLL